MHATPEALLKERKAEQWLRQLDIFPGGGLEASFQLSCTGATVSAQGRQQTTPVLALPQAVQNHKACLVMLLQHQSAPDDAES